MATPAPNILCSPKHFEIQNELFFVGLFLKKIEVQNTLVIQFIWSNGSKLSNLAHIIDDLRNDKEIVAIHNTYVRIQQNFPYIIKKNTKNKSSSSSYDYFIFSLHHPPTHPPISHIPTAVQNLGGWLLCVQSLVHVGLVLVSI